MTQDNYRRASQSSDPQADHLDALLTAGSRGRTAPATHQSTGELAPLLSAADALAPLAGALPRPDFASRLEAQLLARADSQAPTREMPAPPLVARRGAPPARPLLSSRRRFVPVTWAAVAACVMLAMTVGALTANASPGAPFYTLRKVVEGIGTDLSGGQAAIARDSLQRGSTALVAFDTAIKSNDEGAAMVALAQLTQADQQAASAIAQVTDGAQRAALQRQLDSLRQQDEGSLRGALSSLGWPSRVKVTAALHGIGVATLSVTSARVIDGRKDHTESSGSASAASGPIKIIIMGAGFAPGAVLLVDGRPAGVVDSVTPAVVQAHIDATALDGDIHDLGVGEPDGTAASTSHIDSPGREGSSSATPGTEENSTPSPDVTASPGDNGAGTPSQSGFMGVTPASALREP